MSLKAKLNKIKQTWKDLYETSKGETAYPVFEDGRYVAVWKIAEVNESKASGRLQLHLGFEVKEGEHKGEYVHTYIGLDKEVSIGIALRTLVRLGVEVSEDITELDNILEEATKEPKLVRIRLKTKGEYQNVLVDKLLGKAGDEDVVEAVEVEDNEVVEDEEDVSEEAAETSEEEEEEESEEEDEEVAELSVGAKVLFTPKNSTKELTAEVLEIDEEAGKVRIKAEDGKRYKVSADKLELLDASEEEVEEEVEEDEEETEEEIELKVGMDVMVFLKNKEHFGKIKKIDDKTGKISVKLSNGKLVKVEADQLTIVTGKTSVKKK